MNAAEKQDIRFDDDFVLVVDDGQTDYAPIVGMIDDLHKLRAASFFRYLLDWKPYTDASTVRLRTLVHQITTSNETHMQKLADLLAEFGTTPSSAMFKPDMTDANYTDWKNLMPRLIETQQQIVEAQTNALNAMTGCDGETHARPVIEAQLACDSKSLAELHGWSGTLLGN